MKENIILFIIIGLFLITVIFFKNKEGFTSTPESEAAYPLLTSVKTALVAASAAADTYTAADLVSSGSDAASSAAAAATTDFNSKFDLAKTAIENLVPKATAFKTSSALGTDTDSKTSSTQISSAADKAKTDFTAATTIASKIKAVNDANNLFKDIIPFTVQTVVTSGLSSTPLGDTCANNTEAPTTNCDWNSDPTDKSDWWNEHRAHETEAINKVKWNTHTVELGDFIKYPKCYRNPSDKTNEIVNSTFLTLYLIEREKEAKEALTSASNYKKIQSDYDISFSKYKSMLENNSRTISSINDEKERYKRDISNASTKTVYSDNYEYYYEEEGPDGSTCPSLKCVADFGTNIGENLCCGQTGVLQNTEYVCPSVKPTCQNFKCGSKFGTCV